MPKAPLHIGMTLAPTWLSGEAWRRPDSAVEGLLGFDYYIDIARRAEAAKLDFVFRPDVMAVNMGLLGRGGGMGGLDPTLLLSAIAHATDRIGLLTTISTTFYPPYVLARMLMSLHWLSKGRAGWNIVTALDGQRNFSLRDMPGPEERYARAAEVTEIVTRLWDSFPRDAWAPDRDSGRFVDAEMVRPIAFEGQFHSVEGPLSVPSFGTGLNRIPLVQAGASETGRDFAARVADATFASTPDMEAAIDLRRDLRRRALAHGRPADAVRLMPGLSLYLAPTEAEARDLHRATHAAADTGRKLANIREMTGLDLTDWPQDRPIRAADLPPTPQRLRSRTHAALLRRAILRDEPTLAALLEMPEVAGSAHWQVIGTVGHAVDAIRTWQDAGAMDGFILFPGGSTGCMHLCLDGLCPALAEAGLLRREYAHATFAGHLAGPAP
ncbi:NtaA/DmoA family FMN-dependent monooxygenase [Falsirhodobacter algicola]|uniref:NtaA/DmoA family FMN-dependent monooxygenase n=1 Tax=Falsirhodobacter algicola TaxID=2692330 RepID=A0A8J8MSY5_9RHOB|nr:NtaA/DmoA family FMN-dependent monooxygenase [Falsirhodobacter algicola]QUS36151.1 NtaA/DmoA family FMN-dependent monooxygenase [Falsirhodobacter algicola]